MSKQFSNPEVAQTVETFLEKAITDRRWTAGGAAWVAYIFVALALALLGARPFADAAGFSEAQEWDVRAWLLVLSTLVIFALVLILIRFLVGLSHSVIGVLGRTTNRPSFAVVLTLIISGAVCILAALLAEFYSVRSIRITASEMGARVSAYAPFTLTMLAILAFLAGVALVAIGIWGSIHPAPRQPAEQLQAFNAASQ